MNESYKDIYNSGAYLANNASWHEEDSPWKASNIEKIINRNNISPNSICEVGCGAGGILKEMKLKYSDTIFTGYEISEDAFNLCQQKSSNNLKFYLSDIANEDVYYDIVMAIDVFEHVEDYFGFLKMLKNKAKYSIFHIPLDLSVQSVLRLSPVMSARAEVGHIHYFMKETAISTLEDAGFEVIDYFYTKGAYDLPSKRISTKMLNLLRRILFMLSPDFTVRLLGGYSLLVLAR
jgi:hypothetical protein